MLDVDASFWLQEGQKSKKLGKNVGALRKCLGLNVHPVLGQTLG